MTTAIILKLTTGGGQSTIYIVFVLAAQKMTMLGIALLVIERLSMTFTADGKRQRLPLISYSFLVILK